MKTIDVWVTMAIAVMSIAYAAFEFGRSVEHKHVAACPVQNGKIAVTQTVMPNGDIVCSYVRNVVGLATWRVKQ